MSEAGPTHWWVETFGRALVVAFALMVVNALVVSSLQM